MIQLCRIKNANEVKDGVNEVDDEGQSVLNLALENGFVKVVKHLIKEGANINVVATDNTLSLHHAVMCGNVQNVNMCIKKGANVNYINSNGETLLHNAIKECDNQDDINVIKTLLNVMMYV